MEITKAIEKLYDAFLKGASICTDSRSVSKGCIFFALKGPNFNGNHFAKAALQNAASLVIVDEDINSTDSKIIQVDDVLFCLQRLALHHRKQLHIPVIAITGSNGKTTTKELVNRVLSKKYKTLCTKGNLNNHIGVPLTLLSINKNHEVAIIEMGANHQKEIELLCSLALPGYVLITNVGKAHLEGFGGFEGVKKGKGEMYEFARKNNSYVFVNDDDVFLNEMLSEFKNCIRYGKGNRCDVQGTPQQSDFYVHLKWRAAHNLDWHSVKSKITGSFNFENILSAIAIGVHFNVVPDDVTDAIESYIPDNQRSQEIITSSNRVIMDAYNANPTSMAAALKNFNDSFKTNRAVFLGDMLELGNESIYEHQEVINMLRNFAFDVVVLVGENFRMVKGDLNAMVFDSSARATEWLKKQPLENFNILIKGSRGSRMELLLEGL